MITLSEAKYGSGGGRGLERNGEFLIQEFYELQTDTCDEHEEHSSLSLFLGVYLSNGGEIWAQGRVQIDK